MGRPKTPLLSQKRIVDAAAALIDEGGMEHLTTRRLARRLGVTGPSIYNHFDTMESIVETVVDSVLHTVPIDILEEGDWRVSIPPWGRSYWNALTAHPALIPLLAQGPMRRREQLRLANALYGCLLRGGWSKRAATEIAIAIRSYISGSALASYSAGFSIDAEIYGNEFPWLVEAPRLRTVQEEVQEASFERGLSSLIEGLSLQFNKGSAAQKAGSRHNYIEMGS